MRNDLPVNKVKDATPLLADGQGGAMEIETVPGDKAVLEYPPPEANPYLKAAFGPELAARLQQKFLLDVIRKTDLLAQYLKEGRIRELRDIAHQLKGAGGSYGFQNLSEWAVSISELARKGDMKGLSAVISEMDAWARATAHGEE